jgi:hypothetical protein
MEKVARAKLVELAEDKGLVVRISSDPGGERRITITDMPKLYVVLVWGRCHIMLGWLLDGWLLFSRIPGYQLVEICYFNPLAVENQP